MNIGERLEKIMKEIPRNVEIIAVSKTRPVSDILQVYEKGHHVFGENKAQELKTKQPLLPNDIRWHFIGHLQTNKVKLIAPFVHMIESIDSLRLLEEVNREAGRNNRLINCLLQFHIAKEESKFGFSFDEARIILESPACFDMQNIRITGVMGMATLCSTEEIIRNEFRTLRNYFEKLKSDYFSGDPHFREISMGMSSDYRIAIEEGSTMIRLGTAIFSE
jgi:PLP dependent protein